MIKKLAIGLLILFIAAQFIQPSLNQGSSMGQQDISHAVSIPGNVMQVLKKSCFDCHSNQTTYPWYDRISPISWWVADHVNDGKRELNFTEFTQYSIKKQLHKMEEIRETVEKGEMPLKSYLVMHGDAKLTPNDKNLLVDWSRKAETEIRTRQGESDID